MTARDRRNFLRVPFAGEVHCQWAARGSGPAVCTDVSHGGLSLAVDRPLQPGQFVLLTFAPAGLLTEPVELKAHVVWNQQADGHGHVAGLRVYHDEPEAVYALSDLVYAAALSAHGHPAARGRADSRPVGLAGNSAGPVRVCEYRGFRFWHPAATAVT